MTVANFSHERLVMVHFTARQIRAVTEQAFIWAHLRKVFGKSLIEQVCPFLFASFRRRGVSIPCCEWTKLTRRTVYSR